MRWMPYLLTAICLAGADSSFAKTTGPQHALDTVTDRQSDKNGKKSNAEEALDKVLARRESPLGLGDMCDNDYCVQVGERVYYQYALTSEYQIFPVHVGFADARFGTGGRVGSEFLILSEGTEYSFANTFDEQTGWPTFDKETFADLLRNSGGSINARVGAIGYVDMGVHFKDENWQDFGLIRFADDDFTRVSDIAPQYSTLEVTRVSPGTGSRQNSKCSEHRMDGFVTGVNHHGLVSLVPSDTIEGGSMNLLGFGGENSVYICEDTPPGTYDLDMIAIDGAGGKVGLPLKVIVLEDSVDGGSLRWL